MFRGKKNDDKKGTVKMDPIAMLKLSQWVAFKNNGVYKELPKTKIIGLEVNIKVKIMIKYMPTS